MSAVTHSTSTPLTPEQISDLQQRAVVAAHNAYAPYSNFRVGAAILLAPSTNVPAGTVVTGCNVENASFRLTVCAEQAAIAAAVSLYGPQIKLQAVVVINLNEAPCSPCGACRQTILEFGSPTTQIIFPGVNGTVVETSMGDLLPHAFLSDSFVP